MTTFCINCPDVSHGLAAGLRWLKQRGLREDSRNGPVIVSPIPVVTCFDNPDRRVLFSSIRDANPFFHFMEGLWMLGGRNDVAFPSQFNKRFSEYSDDGETFHGAYGYRWRQYFGYDQLEAIIEELKRNPTSRRCVLSMWDGGHLIGPLGNHVHEREPDLLVAMRGGKDVPCNTNVFFRIESGKLNMMVNNRSNDIIWGTFGANAVHMSMMMEYVARCVGVGLGRYWQSSFNFHAYTDAYPVDGWDDMVMDITQTHSYSSKFQPLPLMHEGKERWDMELNDFLDFGYGTDPAGTAYAEPLFQDVAVPMLRAWHAHKAKDYSEALSHATKILARDWREACYDWLKRRRTKLEEKNVG